MQQGVLSQEDLLGQLLADSLAGLQYYARSGELQHPAQYRLAFRELGLAIGLHAVQSLWQAALQHEPATAPRTRAALEGLMRYLPLGEEIESFWRNPEHQVGGTWSEHRDINEVMLATSLAPEGCLVLRSLE